MTGLKQHLEDYECSIPINDRPDLNDNEENVRLIRMIDFAHRNKVLHESLAQLKQGPIWDGDVVSKSERNTLLQVGACVKVSMKGEQGYNACTYFGCELLSVFDWLYQ